MAKQKKPSKKTKPFPSKTNASGNYPDWLVNARMHRFIIFFFCCFLYANTLFHDYTLDDAIVIYDNEFVNQGFAGIDDILKYDTFRGFFKVEGKESLVAGGRYRPLTLIIFAIQNQIFGNSTFIGHATAVLVYALTCLVLYSLLLRIFAPNGNTKKAGVYAFFISFIATLIFASHPLHTEVVANIKGMDETMTLLGSLAAMHFSLKAYYDKDKLANLWAGLFFFLALLSKENSITFLAVVPLTYFFFTKANLNKIVMQTLPFLVGAVAFIALRTAILGFIVTEPSQELMNNPFLKLVGNQYVDLTGGEKFATIFFTLGKYIQLLFFPHPLTHDYYPRAIEIMTFSDWRSITSLLMYIGLGVYALMRLPKKDPISYGILFYLATISIASNIVFAIGTNMSERFAFIPSIGFAIIVAVIAFRFANRMKDARKLKELNHLNLVLGGLGLILLLFSAKTVTRNMVWKDNYTLFLTDARAGTNSAKLRNAAGGELVTQSVKPENESKKVEMLNEAVGHLEEAIRIHPGYKNAFLLLGNAHNYLQNYEESISNYEQALRLDPSYQEALNNLGITYREAGKFYGEQRGDLPKALEYLNKAYERRPDEYETIRLLGVAYGIGGNISKTIEMFSKAVQIEPNNADAHFNLGSAYFQAGNPTQAEVHFAKAREINPNIDQERQQNSN